MFHKYKDIKHIIYLSCHHQSIQINNYIVHLQNLLNFIYDKYYYQDIIRKVILYLYKFSKYNGKVCRQYYLYYYQNNYLNICKYHHHQRHPFFYRYYRKGKKCTLPKINKFSMCNGIISI